MPKIVDHEQRREDIAHVACQVIAKHGFEQATVARIARAAGFTTGMVAHYFESKQQIVIAALRLILTRMEQRLNVQTRAGETSLFKVLSESLAIDAQRFAECAFWTAFWGQVTVDPTLKRINAAVHKEYQRLYERSFALCWPEWPVLAPKVRAQVLGSFAIFINGLTASAVTSRSDWPPERQIEQLRLQLDLLKRWANER
jgi:TetR/AcrR family transcriptional regulator, transcriptional repressor of bet genes